MNGKTTSVVSLPHALPAQTPQTILNQLLSGLFDGRIPFFQRDEPRQDPLRPAADKKVTTAPHEPERPTSYEKYFLPPIVPSRSTSG
jgi:hypothetical protein